MKWSVVGLVILGILAAISAAVLVGALKAGHGDSTHVVVNPDIMIVVATRTLPPKTVLEGSMLKTVPQPRDQAPPNAITDITQAAGKVLIRGVAEGEVLKRDLFAPEGGTVQLAAQLNKDKHERGIEINVTDAGGLVGKLIPGSIVDVLVAVHKQGDEAPESISIPLLQYVQVMGVDQLTVVAPEPDKKADTNPHQGMHKVMLNVDDEQAQKLQLAQLVGTLYLVLRNPTDVATTKPGAVTLASIFGPDMLPRSTNIGANTPPETNRATPATNTSVVPVATTQTKQEPTWTMTIIRGDQAEKRTFPYPHE